MSDDERRLLAAHGIWPDEINDSSTIGRLHLLCRLADTLTDMRKSGLAGDWTYSLPEHRALKAIYDREVAALVEVQDA